MKNLQMIFVLIGALYFSPVFLQPCGTPPTINFSQNTVTVCLGEDGQNAATVIGAVGDIEYNWFPISGNGNTIEFSVTSDTWIYLEITDDCFTVLDSMFVNVDPINVSSINVTNATNCPSEPGTLGSIQIVPDDPTWTYYLNSPDLIVGPVFTSTFNDLNGGVAYWVKIVNSNGCELDTAIQVGVGSNGLNATFNTSALTHVTCYDDSTGVAEFTNATGGITPPYDVYWSNHDGIYDQSLIIVAEGSQIGNLPVGTWTLNIIDQAGCAWSEIFEITGPEPFSFNVNTSSPTCFGYNDGSLTFSVSGGNGGNSYMVQNASGTIIGPSGTPNILSEGWYFLTVTDDENCVGKDSVFIDAPDEIDATFSYEDPWCATDGDGAIFVTSVSNYHGNYNDLSFYWSPDIHDISGIGADTLLNTNGGEYTLVINDSHGCYRVFDLFLWPDTLFFITLGATISNDGTDGSVYCTAGGGDGTYNYLWTNLETSDEYTTSTVNGLEPGDYEITLTDGSDCFIKDTVRIEMLTISETENLVLQILQLGEGKILIRTKNLSGNSTMNIYSVSGQRMVSSIIHNGESKQIFQLESGTYLIEIIDEKSSVSYTEKFIVVRN